MDMQRFKQISDSKIKAGQMTNKVKDMQLGFTETFQLIIKAQEEVIETIDDKQEKLIEQIQKSQRALTSGLEDIAMDDLSTYIQTKSSIKQTSRRLSTKYDGI